MMDYMPEFKPISLDQRVERALAPKTASHHSVTDWDFQNVSWALNETVYHTAAPSLDFTGNCIALVTDAASGALSDGRFVTWARVTATTFILYFHFRNQIADGTAAGGNNYMIIIQVPATGIKFYRVIGGTPVLLDTHTHSWTYAINTWYKLRVTWWSSSGILWVRVERWTGSAWVTLGGAADVDFQDATDQFKDAAVNRVGFQGTATMFFDDVEVWG